METVIVKQKILFCFLVFFAVIFILNQCSKKTMINAESLSKKKNISMCKAQILTEEIIIFFQKEGKFPEKITDLKTVDRGQSACGYYNNLAVDGFNRKVKYMKNQSSSAILCVTTEESFGSIGNMDGFYINQNLMIFRVSNTECKKYFKE